jgi:hypothetical protein
MAEADTVAELAAYCGRNFPEKSTLKIGVGAGRSPLSECMECVMAKFIGSNGRSAFAIGLATAAVAACAAFALPSASRAAGDCLSAPSGQSPSGQHWFYRVDRENGRKCWYLAQVGERVHRTAPVRHAETSRAAPAARSTGERVASSQSQAAGGKAPDDTALKSVDAAAPSDPSGRGLTTGQAAAASPPPSPPSPQRSNPFAGWPDPAAGSAASSAAAAVPSVPDAPAILAAPAAATAQAPAAAAVLATNNPVAQEQSVARPVTAADANTPVTTAKATPAQDASQVSMVSLIIGFAGALLASALAAHFILKVAAAWRRRTYLENRARQTMRPVREPFGGNEPNLMAAQVRNRPEPLPRRDIARGLFPNGSEQRVRPDALRELLAPLDRDTRPRR